MRTRLLIMTLLVSTVMGSLISCSESDATWNPYYEWQPRNTQWYEQVADTARRAIAEAKAQYGDAWKDHCEWRMYHTLLRSETKESTLEDTICCQILTRGTGDYIPTFSDTVRLSFRGWTMATEYEQPDGSLKIQQQIFSDTYHGDFDLETEAPQLMAISAATEGFGTALQYMCEGDDWVVYVPAELAYKNMTTGVIPAYSTLKFRIHMAAVYPCGSGVKPWK